MFSYAPHDMYQLTITRYSGGVSFSSLDGAWDLVMVFYPSVQATAKTVFVCGYSAHVRRRPSDWKPVALPVLSSWL